ncbi:helix-turn-helix transcriptional regulator [Eilatimonas milleporae]|uniref:Uncharacterized protein n=1 Tax=Eilatimonas milleporae TaxID=911205 RepID=A0A3M0CT28_9PROT|nr:hypothetical protein [Eilatimonas milleporae]RMB12147.1 hypothetical protein BXY39_0638 [Eilatimonas milleporae]
MADSDVKEFTSERNALQSNSGRLAIPLTEQLSWSAKEAAAACGVSASTFSAWVRQGLMPQPWKGTKRYSAAQIRQAFSVMDEQNAFVSSLDMWRANRG